MAAKKPYLFPACAGMNRSVPFQNLTTLTVPRMRGDEPVTDEMRELGAPCSPHARG